MIYITGSDGDSEMIDVTGLTISVNSVSQYDFSPTTLTFDPGYSYDFKIVKSRQPIRLCHKILSTSISKKLTHFFISTFIDGK